ncbi:hypothetical protein [Ferirhizobium litorale]|uniref:hypothetical protein n=1 Tax=Ferirhizobium litorale TaxID=2927786 RepID=UPI0035300301
MTVQYSDLDPPLRRRSLLVRPDGSAVDNLDLAEMRGGRCIQQAVPYTRLAQPDEAIVDL